MCRVPLTPHHNPTAQTTANNTAQPQRAFNARHAKDWWRGGRTQIQPTENIEVTLFIFTDDKYFRELWLPAAETLFTLTSKELESLNLNKIIRLCLNSRISPEKLKVLEILWCLKPQTCRKKPVVSHIISAKILRKNTPK